MPLRDFSLLQGKVVHRNESRQTAEGTDGCLRPPVGPTPEFEKAWRAQALVWAKAIQPSLATASGAANLVKMFGFVGGFSSKLSRFLQNLVF